ncbi:helix-turn-helix domain-containing protein [Solicola gregarius]|uniref:Helix-turn-helix transcriptional regulator n=1 Tax=Solicola gregarius TaxID=2908642 RepID=A0AA46YJK2_9ACTN|nr:helix-turn-helix transcriptional regulator [Solicola gregarius]UYM03674.1 helix-turn-helix transcriptional regulator [Solicola gregarius]
MSTTYDFRVTIERTESAIGPLLREWRNRRSISQLDLSIEADISSRHLSFLETGRSKPSRDMVLRLAERLDIPLRERNQLLLAAGFAPAYSTLDLDDDEMRPIRVAIDRVLGGYAPFPALVVDRGWHLVASNDAVPMLLTGLPDELLAPPVNVLRASLHPDGLAPRIANLAEWRGHILERLAREIAVTASDELRELYDELASYPGGLEPGTAEGRVAVPLRLRTPDGELAFISTVTTFGTAVDVTLAELSIEAFLPANQETADALRN